MTDDIVVILPRREAQGLYDLLDGGLAPKPVNPLSIHKGPPVMVALRSVFPSVHAALEDALKAEEQEHCPAIQHYEDISALGVLEGCARICTLTKGHEGPHQSDSDRVTWE